MEFGHDGAQRGAGVGFTEVSVCFGQATKVQGFQPMPAMCQAISRVPAAVISTGNQTPRGNGSSWWYGWSKRLVASA
jgi:hypothetical protein